MSLLVGNVLPWSPCSMQSDQEQRIVLTTEIGRRSLDKNWTKQNLIMKTDCSGLFKCPCNVVCEHGLHMPLIVACWCKPCQNNQNNQWLLFQNWKRNIIKLDFFHSVLSPYVRCDGDSWILIVMWENDVWWRAAKWPHQTSRRSWVKCCVSRQEVLSPGPSWQPTPTPPTTSGRSVQSPVSVRVSVRVSTTFITWLYEYNGSILAYEEY